MGVELLVSAVGLYKGGVELLVSAVSAVGLYKGQGLTLGPWKS